MHERTSTLEPEISREGPPHDSFHAPPKPSRLRGRWVMLFILLLVLVAVIAVVARARRQAAPMAPAETKAAAVAPQPIEVTTAPAITRNLQRSVEVVGSLAADVEV